MNLYLSKLSLNNRSRQAQSELRDPYEMHRTLSKAFTDDHAQNAEGRCLFRVDEALEGKSIQSLTQPGRDMLYLLAASCYIFRLIGPAWSCYAPVR